jgi:hypothetical protein
MSQTVDPQEDMKVIDKLWDRLEQAIQSREQQLEQAISR